MRRVLFSALFLLTACAHSAYQRASEVDTVEAYRAFLLDTPKGDLAESALARIEELEFEEATRLHTVVAYKRFLEAHPDSSHTTAARARLEGLRFNAAQSKNTAQAMRQHLQAHPDGANREAAERLLAAAELDEASHGGGASQLSAALQRTQDESTKWALEKQLDDARYAEAMKDGAFGLFAYLREQRAGAHREAVRVELLRLELLGLHVSGLDADALVRLDAHPLGDQLGALRERIIDSQRATLTLRGPDVTLRNAEADYHLRSIEDLVRSLASPDPLDRWQAAEELGHHASVHALTPLLDAVRAQRNARVRQQAFDSFGRVLQALPREVRDFEVASRLEALRATAASHEVYLSLAALLDFSGRRELAATEYQRAYDPRYPDAVILRRWASLRRERGEHHSSAVAARQLALWAREQGQGEAGESASWTLPQARAVCASVDAARFAVATVTAARSAHSEFPEDVVAFEKEIQAVARLMEARLADVELALRTRQIDLRPCGDTSVSQRLAGAEQARKEALEQLAARRDSRARIALERARDRDPSPPIRALASRLLGASGVTADGRP